MILLSVVPLPIGPEEP
jgi:hypothetical protein